MKKQPGEKKGSCEHVWQDVSFEVDIRDGVRYLIFEDVCEKCDSYREREEVVKND